MFFCLEKQPENEGKVRLTRAKSIPMQTTITQPFFNVLKIEMDVQIRQCDMRVSFYENILTFNFIIFFTL